MKERSAHDRDLVRLVLEGDDRAFERLVEQYQRLVAGIAWRSGLRQDAVDDVVSEVFMKVYTNLHRYRPEHPFSTWLYRLATNHVIDWQRRRRKERENVEIPEQLAAPGPGAGEQIDSTRRTALVRRALRDLPARYRETIFLVYLEGRKLEEVADLLGIPLGTVKSRLMRGRESLRKLLVRRHPGILGGHDVV